MKPDTRGKIFELLMILAALALALGYLIYFRDPLRDGELKYFAQFPPELFRLPMFMLRNAPAFFWTLLLALAGLGLAFLILEKAFQLRLPAGFLLGTGMGLLGLLIFYLGAVHLLYPDLIKGLISILALPGLYFAFRRLSAMEGLRRATVLEALLVLIFSVNLVMVLVKPTFFYDTLSYHFSLPRQYLLHNSIAPFPTIAYSHFPEAAEMIYLAGLATGGQLTAQLTNLIFWLAIILLSREIFRSFFPAAPKLVVTALLLSLPVLNYLGQLITNDLAVGFLILAGVYALSAEEFNLSKRSLLFGLVAGLACSIKLNSYIYLLVPQSLWLAGLVLKEDRRNFLRHALAALLVFVIICLPFWVRNLATTGNPLYPALASRMGGYLSLEQSRAILDDAHFLHWSPAAFKLLFKISSNLFYTPVGAYGKNPLVREIPFFGTALGAGLLLSLLKRPSRKLVPLFIYCLVLYITWAWTFRLARFGLGLWVLLAIISAGGFAGLLLKGRVYRKLAAAALSVAVLSGLTLDLLNGAREAGWYFLAHGYRAETYLSRLSKYQTIQLGAYPVFNWLNHNSRPDDQALLLGPTSFFYLERKAVASSFIDWNPLMILFNSDKRPEEVCQILRDEPIAYLVFQPAELARLSRQYPANRLTASGRERMDEFFASPCLELVMKQDSPLVHLYRIKKIGLP